MGGAPGSADGDADRTRRVDDRRHHRQRDRELLEQRLVPPDRGGVDEVGDGGVGGVGDVERVGACRGAARERPGHPAVDRAEAQLPRFGPRAFGVDLVEDGHHLGGRRVGGQADALALEDEAGAHGPQVLPADAGGDRPSAGALPHDARGPLVGDADARHRATVRERGMGHLQDGVGHACRVELHQARAPASRGGGGHGARARRWRRAGRWRRGRPRSRRRRRGCCPPVRSCPGRRSER